ncbi:MULTISPECIES: hypothetical protein [Nocardia]|uniref:hypothetical protein n=1 Tax=Nocardia TaxID=1817 RepID=UPI002457AF88|nr:MULTISPECIES: hypothetical protein [Nocardia]
MSEREDAVSTMTLTVLVYVVAIVWATNLLAPLVIKEFQVNTGVNGIMGALIGLLGALRYRKIRNREPQEKEDRDE